MDLLEKILILVTCHLVGDYVLQSDFIANTKKENWYNMFVHCVLYCLPFYLVFGFGWKLLILFISHITVDVWKERYKKFGYIEDQLWHYFFATMYLLN